MMRKLIFIAILIAVLAAFFASTHPDGLDFVAEKFGFADKAQERSALLPPSAGIAGVFITLSLFWVGARVFKTYGKHNV
ncbi:MAG: PDGLE domain-containing protein [Candidatus Margulisiibacteriota bacterium]